jgi:hypothetical protein
MYVMCNFMILSVHKHALISMNIALNFEALGRHVVSDFQTL